MIDDIKTQSGCLLKSFCIALSYIFDINPPQLLNQGAQFVASQIGKPVSKVVAHFCNPEKGWCTAGPLLKWSLLKMVCSFRIKCLSELCLFLNKSLDYLIEATSDPIFIVGLQYHSSSRRVGHSFVCLLTHKKTIVCACDPIDFLHVHYLYVYHIPKENLAGCEFPHPIVLTLNGEL